MEVANNNNTNILANIMKLKKEETSDGISKNRKDNDENSYEN